MGEAAKKIFNWATHTAPGVTLRALLDAEPANDTKPRVIPEYKWIHCCNEGDYRGHHQGAFEMTRAVFEQFVKNFRESPQYKTGELDLAERGKHTGGVAPVIQFDYEHASEMPAFLGDIPHGGAPAPAWALDVQIREGADGKAQLWVFAKLGKKIREQIAEEGYLWVSIAFTLEGRHWITAEPIGAVLTSIAFTNHPFMQDLESLAASARATSQPARAAVRSSSEPPEAPGGNRDSTRTGATMDEKLRERICKALKIRVAASDDEVGAAVEEAVTGAGDLGKVLEALGVTASGDALKVIPELRGALGKVEAVAKELRELLAGEQAADTGQVAPADAAAAMRSRGLDETDEAIRKGFVAYRSHLIEAELKKLTKAGEELKPAVWRKAVTAAREAFFKTYGIDKPGHDHLGESFVATAGGTQLEPPDERVLTVGADGRGQGTTIDLRGIDGRNDLQKMITHLRKHEQGFDQLSWPQQCVRAYEELQTANVVAA